MKADARMLIVKGGALGDIILTLPMLRTLRHAYPKAYIAWIVESPFQDILHGNRDLDRLFVVDTSSVRRIAVTLWRAIRDARADAFDVVVDLQGWIKSQVFCVLSGARSMTGVQKKNELGFHILKHGVPPRQDAHMADLFLDVATLLGADQRQISFEIPISAADRDYVERFISTLSIGTRRVAILQPGTSWQNKRWSAQKLADVGRSLVHTDGFFPVVAWGPREHDEATEVAHLLGDAGVLAPPTNIPQLAALLERSHLYVGTDSGPMHLASALGVPTVGIFGPSNPVKFGPYRAPSQVVRRHLPCSPCGAPTCRLNTTECMASIEPSEVLDAIARL